MRVAIFYPVNVYASWYVLGGYVECLRKMGHEVIDVPLPGNCYRGAQGRIEAVKFVPTLPLLNSCDAILLTFLEHINGWLEVMYGEEAWSHVTTPVVARFDESFDRADLGLPERWDDLKRWAQYYSFPAAQDARKFDGQWLPYGADTDMFTVESRRGSFDVGFVGTLYGKRANYASLLVRLMPTVPFHHGPVLIQDLRGYRFYEQTKLLAENYGMLKVFFCLPPLSNLLVAKVFEVMSCGTFLMFPRLPGSAEENLSIFEDRKHLAYYELGNYAENAEQIRYWLKHEDEREAIALEGKKLVRERYSLERMFTSLFSLIPKPIPLA